MTHFQATLLLLFAIIILMLAAILWLSLRREASALEQSQLRGLPGAGADADEPKRCCNFNCNQGRDCPLIKHPARPTPRESAQS
jgi:hypothetical protein